MSNDQAIKLAIEALQIWRHTYAVDANFHDTMGAVYPVALTASKKRKELNEAIEVLKQYQHGLFERRRE